MKRRKFCAASSRYAGLGAVSAQPPACGA